MGSIGRGWGWEKGVPGQTAAQRARAGFVATHHCLTCPAHPPLMCFGGCLSICRSAKVTVDVRSTESQFVRLAVFLALLYCNISDLWC